MQPYMWIFRKISKNGFVGRCYLFPFDNSYHIAPLFGATPHYNDHYTDHNHNYNYNHNHNNNYENYHDN